ncbi:DJ-1 family glyoxalase III [Candidatus Omnitrophota bacterium]
MSKRAIVVIAEGFEEIEAITLIDILRRAEIDVVVAGLDNVKICGAHGVNITTDKKLDDAGNDFDACIFPGGMPGATNLADSEKVKALIKKINSDGKVIAAICASPAIVLAPTGILKNKYATCYPGMHENFGKDVKFKEDAVVVDANIITSRGPGTALSFSLAIVEKLLGTEVKDKIKKATLAG